MEPLAILAAVLGAFVLVVVVVLGGLSLRFLLGRRRVERLWAAARYPPVNGLGTVKRLTVLPLIDRKTARADLAGEAGVSYLVQADGTTILFDAGWNARGEHPSPLLRNMQALGVTPGQVHYVVISHLHVDHVGGFRNQRRRTFSLSGLPLDLSAATALAPTPMTHPTARVQVADGPRVIAPGVATLGPIPRQLFFLGLTLEQSLAVHVEGKGVVLIIGCGHPTVQRIVERAERLLEAPAYGFIGGLHYPVTALAVQRWLGTNNWPWRPASKQEVGASIEFLRLRHPGVVALSTHDSCDWSIEAFRQAFPAAYRDVRVGSAITV